MLVEKILQFKLPAAHSVRVPAVEAQGTTRLWVVGLAAEVLTLAAAFFLGFPAVSLGAAVVLGSGF